MIAMNCAWTVVHTTRRKIHTASMVAWTPCGFSKAVQWTSNEGPMKVQRRSRAQGGVSPGDRSERSPPSTNRRASRLAGTHSAPFAPPPPSGRKHRMTQHVTTAIITVMHARRIKRTAPSDIPTDDTVHTAPQPHTRHTLHTVRSSYPVSSIGWPLVVLAHPFGELSEQLVGGRRLGGAHYTSFDAIGVAPADVCTERGNCLGGDVRKDDAGVHLKRCPLHPTAIVTGTIRGNA